MHVAEGPKPVPRDQIVSSPEGELLRAAPDAHAEGPMPDWRGNDSEPGGGTTTMPGGTVRKCCKRPRRGGQVAQQHPTHAQSWGAEATRAACAVAMGQTRRAGDATNESLCVLLSTRRRCQRRWAEGQATREGAARPHSKGDLMMRAVRERESDYRATRRRDSPLKPRKQQKAQKHPRQGAKARGGRRWRAHRHHRCKRQSHKTTTPRPTTDTPRAGVQGASPWRAAKNHAAPPEFGARVCAPRAGQERPAQANEG